MVVVKIWKGVVKYFKEECFGKWIRFCYRV